MNHLIFLLTLILLTPFFAEAQELQLTNIPFVNEAGGGISGVVEGLFYLAIVVAGMFAVVKLVIAGAKYMMSDVVTTKQSALGDIKGAIIGLLLILGTVVILDTINDGITEANLSLPEADFDFGNGDENLEGGDGDFIQTCNELGAGTDCTQIDCEIFNSPEMGEYIGIVGTIVGYGVQFTGMDYVLNVGTCKARCDWVGGQITNNSFGESGTCVYPNDSEVAEENLRNLETETIRTTIEEIRASDPASTLPEVPDNAAARVCATQTGPNACQAARSACASGDMSSDGESGSPIAPNVEGVGRVVVCNF